MTWLDILVFSGVWIYPPSYFLCRELDNVLYELKFVDHRHPFGIWLMALIPVILVLIGNCYCYYVYGQRHFSLGLRKGDGRSRSKEKRNALYPSVPARYRSKKPEGMILGLYRGDYFRIPIDPRNVVNGTILGAPGSGKSAGPYLSSLIANFSRQNEEFTCFLLDIKPELAYKSVPVTDPRMHVINPTDRTSYGWNIYYRMDPDASDDKILKELDVIANALIVSNNEKDKFFVNNGRTIFKACMLYYFRKGVNFIDSVTNITSKTLDSHLNEILADKSVAAEGGKISGMLRRFVGKDSEALQDIELTLQENLGSFLLDDVRFFLRDNPKMAAPSDLDDKVSLSLSIPEHMLTDSFEPVFRLITLQVLKFLESRDQRVIDDRIKNGDNPMVLLILDEFARVGKIDRITDTLATARSKCVSVWMAFQDRSQVESLYGKENARTLMNLPEVTVILSTKDIDTAKWLSDLAGEYKEERVSVTRSGSIIPVDSGKRNISKEHRKVVEVADVLSLKADREVMVIAEGRYFRIPAIRYYEDPVLRKRHEEVLAVNAISGTPGHTVT